MAGKFGTSNVEIQKNVSLASFNTLRLTVQAERFAVAESLADVAQAAGLVAREGIALQVLGAGSNVVLRNDLPGLTLRMGIHGRSCINGLLTASAGEYWDPLVDYAIDQGGFGLENLSMIPGTVGATPVQNIGAYGTQLSDRFAHLTAFDRRTDQFVELNRAACGFGYRDSIFKSSARGRYIICEVSLFVDAKFLPNLAYPGVAAWAGAHPDARAVRAAVMALRSARLPDLGLTPNVGSFFKNPIIGKQSTQALLAANPDLVSWEAEGGYKLSAGWLIERAGCKGMAVGGAMVSEQHALVLVNRGNARPADIEALSQQVQRRVQDAFGLTLEIEPDCFPES